MRSLHNKDFCVRATTPPEARAFPLLEANRGLIQAIGRFDQGHPQAEVMRKG